MLLGELVRGEVCFCGWVVCGDGGGSGRVVKGW